MTWAEFKTKVEQLGVTDTTDIEWIDVQGSEDVELFLPITSNMAAITSSY